MQSSSQIVTNKPTPSFLQVRCPSCRPTNSVKALKGSFCYASVKGISARMYMTGGSQCSKRSYHPRSFRLRLRCIRECWRRPRFPAATATSWLRCASGCRAGNSSSWNSGRSSADLCTRSGKNKPLIFLNTTVHYHNSPQPFRIEMCMGMGFTMGPGIPWESHGNGNKTQNWEWETTSVGMGITCTPMGIYSRRFYAAMSLLSY